MRTFSTGISAVPRGFRRTCWAGALTAGLCLAAVTPGQAAPSSWSSPSDPITYSSPVELKTAGRTLVVVADTNGWLTARDGSGNVVWKSAIDPQPGTRSPSSSAPSVGDITGDGVPEVVVGAGGIDPKLRQAHGGVVAFRADGSTLWRFRTKDTFNTFTGGGPDGYSDGVFASPAIGDVDGDGRSDVVFGSFDHFVYALDGAGKQITAPYDTWDTVFSTPALVNIDDDPAQEILIGGDATPNAAIKWSAKGVVRALNPTRNGMQQLWVRQFNDVVPGGPAVADINGDGRLEAVFATGGYYNDPVAARQVWAVDAKTGSTVAGFPVLLDKPSRTHVALGQLVAGGPPEIVLGDLYGGVYAFNGQGQRLWKGRVVSNDVLGPGYGNEGGGVIVADVNGDGKQEVVVPNGWGGVDYLNGQTGASIAAKVGAPAHAIVSAPAVVNFGSQGGRQLVMAGTRPGYSGQVTGVSLPSTSTADSWPTFHQRPDRIGAPAPVETDRYLKLSNAFYADMLGRSATQDELRHWARQMTLTNTRTTGATGFENSIEYRRLRVANFYQTFLGRNSSPAERDWWANEIGSGRTNLDTVMRQFMASAEFYKQGGGTPDGFVRMIYARTLGRDPSAAEIAHWRQVLDRPNGRYAAIAGIYDSPESARLRVDRAYRTWLTRSAQTTERQYWTQNVLTTGDEGMRRQVMVSQEYYNRAQSR